MSRWARTPCILCPRGRRGSGIQRLTTNLDTSTGRQATATIRRESPTAKILELTTLIGDEHVYRAIQSGELGYVLKEADENEQIGAIRSTHAGLRTMPAAVEPALAKRLAFDPLSARELEVLNLVAQGPSNREARRSRPHGRCNRSLTKRIDQLQQ